MTTTPTTTFTRQRTVFQLCAEHAWIARDGRYRTAETFAEGGPGSACSGGSCKIRPGTDLFVAYVCGSREWYDTSRGTHLFVWPANARAEA